MAESKASTSGWKYSKHGDLKTVVLYVNNGSNSAAVEVSLFGAHVFRWEETNKQPFIFLSKYSKLDGTKALRGGIPICFPQFADLGDLPAHGFARTSTWNVLEEKSKQTGDGKTAEVTFSLKTSATTTKIWDNQFSTSYTVILHGSTNSQLEIRWNVTNLNTEKSFSFTCALHTYFQVADINGVSVSDVKGLKYVDKVRDKKEFTASESSLTFKGETDAIYKGTPDTLTITDSKGKRKIVISKSGLPDAVIWNPWIHKSKKMGDFGDEEYNTMVCVEGGAVGTPVVLGASKTWTGVLRLSSSKL